MNRFWDSKFIEIVELEPDPVDEDKDPDPAGTDDNQLVDEDGDGILDPPEGVSIERSGPWYTVTLPDGSEKKVRDVMNLTSSWSL